MWRVSKIFQKTESTSGYLNRTYWIYNKGVVLEYANQNDRNNPTVQDFQVLTVKQARSKMRKLPDPSLEENIRDWKKHVFDWIEGQPVNVEFIYQCGLEFDLDYSTCKKMLDKWKQEGTIMEPRPGKIMIP